MAPVPEDHPLMVAWNAYKATDDYANSRKWAIHRNHADDEQYVQWVEGSLWAAFMAGFNAGLGHNQPPTKRQTRST